MRVIATILCSFFAALILLILTFYISDHSDSFIEVVTKVLFIVSLSAIYPVLTIPYGISALYTGSASSMLWFQFPGGVLGVIGITLVGIFLVIWLLLFSLIRLKRWWSFTGCTLAFCVWFLLSFFCFSVVVGGA